MTLRIVTEAFASLQAGTLLSILGIRKDYSMTYVKIFGNKTTELWIPDVAVKWFTEEIKEGV